MINKDLLKVELANSVCLDTVSEDDVRALVNALRITIEDKEFEGLVRTTSGTQLKFEFGPDGAFRGLYATLGGKRVMLIPGSNSSGMAIFKGAPSSTNPGAGWALEEDLSRKYLQQTGVLSTWDLFYATRVSVLNNI